MRTSRYQPSVANALLFNNLSDNLCGHSQDDIVQVHSDPPTHHSLLSCSNKVICFLYGAIAQLGERLPCTQEVSGSIPLSSTI